jgi:hypothetical protein
VSIDEVGFRHEFVVPHLLEEHGACQDLAVAAHHIFEQAEFSRQEVERSVAAPRYSIGEIKLEGSHAKEIRGVRGTYGLGRGARRGGNCAAGRN